MRILVTRPEEDARPLRDQLEALGAEPVVVPLMTVAQNDDASVDLGGVQALAFTSANGVRAFARACEARALPVFAVGDATARTARETGFAEVSSAGGNVDDLSRLIAERLDPSGGTVFHAAGRDLAGDLSGQLEARGFAVRRTVLYRALQPDALPEAIADLLRRRRLDGVLLFSPRSATSFVSLVDAAKLLNELAYVTLYALSDAVAEAAGQADWAHIRIASRPEQGALLDLVDHDIAAMEARSR